MPDVLKISLKKIKLLAILMLIFAALIFIAQMTRPILVGMIECQKECDVYRSKVIEDICHCKIKHGWAEADLVKMIPLPPKKKQKTRGRDDGTSPKRNNKRKADAAISYNDRRG